MTMVRVVRKGKDGVAPYVSYSGTKYYSNKLKPFEGQEVEVVICNQNAPLKSLAFSW